MDLPNNIPGTIESALSGHFPTQAVLFEAGALDRELGYNPPCWEPLLRSIASFSIHYPAVLLQAPAAIVQLGEACLHGLHQSPGSAMRSRSVHILVELLRGVCVEVSREGPERIPQSIPLVVDRLLRGLLDDSKWMKPLISLDENQLVPPLLALGKQFLLVVSEGIYPGNWEQAVRTLDGLLIQLIRHRVEGEPFYDGRWDSGEISGQLTVALLEKVRIEYIEHDLAWLAGLEERLEKDSISPVDAFLELAAYTNRQEREEAWEAWFAVLAAIGNSGGLALSSLQEFCSSVAQWMTGIQDRRFLSRIAANLRGTVVALARTAHKTGLEFALDTVGSEIIKRLKQETAKGDIDITSQRLRIVVSDLFESYLDQTDPPFEKKRLEIGSNNRTGPLQGHPFSREDVIWRLQLVVKHRSIAQPFLLPMIVGFSVEELVLQEEGSGCRNRMTLVQALGDMLGRFWQHSDQHLVRTIVRITPLSPHHLGNASTYSHLMALDPDCARTSYLIDLKEKVLSGGSSESLAWVESVLWFWSTGNPRYLDNLASPESMAALSVEDEKQRTTQIRQLIQRLGEHAPVSGDTVREISWLGDLPDSYYLSNTIVKVAGFADCAKGSVESLCHVLNIYRDLMNKARHCEAEKPKEHMTVRQMLKRVDEVMAQRKGMVEKLFNDNGLEGLEPAERMEMFRTDLDLFGRCDQILENLALACMQESGNARMELGAKIVGRMLANASLSGLGNKKWDGLISHCLSDGALDHETSAKLLKLLRSTRGELIKKLKPRVADSIRRLRTNPFARPAVAYAELVNADRLHDESRLVDELSGLLTNDLYSTDGGILGIERFIQNIQSL